MCASASSFEPQYHALKGSGAIVQLHDWTCIFITGADRRAFLHNFCTNDIKRLSPGTSCEAFFTSVKGKVLGHGVVSCRDDELMIIGSPGQGPALATHLERYVIREDVRVRDATGERVFVLSTLATAASEAARSAVALSITGCPNECILEFHATELATFLDEEHNRSLLVTSDAFEAARIENGFPLFGVDFDNENLPQEVARDKQAISFTKGCYLGQETVARIDALGHVNQRLVGVRFFGDAVPPIGMELSMSGTVVGRITSACWSPSLSAPLAIALARRQATAAGTRLESAVGAGEIVELPLHPYGRHPDS